MVEYKNMVRKLNFWRTGESRERRDIVWYFRGLFFVVFEDLLMYIIVVCMVLFTCIKVISWLATMTIRYWYFAESIDEPLRPEPESIDIRLLRNEITIAKPFDRISCFMGSIWKLNKLQASRLFEQMKLLILLLI